MNAGDPQTLELHLTPEHPCAYLAGRAARTAFVDPDLVMDGNLYGLLAAHGFRRSGPHVYRPHCPACRACVPVRIPVTEFRPDRTQRRVWRRNADLSVEFLPATFHPEHYQLYTRYLEARHPGGGMQGGEESDYSQFLMSPWGESFLMELRRDGELLAVAVVDELKDALSAVYTFYEPGVPERSLGSFAILREIEEARSRGLAWLYLGYWIAESRKMAYKERYQPQERLGQDGWQRADRIG